MSARYQVLIYDWDYNLVAVPAQWESLDYSVAVDDIGECKFTLVAPDPTISLIQKDYLIEIQRKDEQYGVDWYTDAQYFVRARNPKMEDNKKRTRSFIGRSPLYLLTSHDIMYPADSIYAGKSGPADDMMKAYVTDNITIAATAPPRLIDGTQLAAIFNVAPNLGAAPDWTGSMQGRNLLDVVKEIGLAFEVDFDLVFTGTRGSPMWEFRTYYPQSGTDRTDSAHGPLVFSPRLGNLALPDYTEDATSEITAVLVQGQGSADARETYFLASLAATETPYNYRESTQSQRQEDTAFGLASSAQYFLNHLQQQVLFSGRVLQTSQTVMHRDYEMGDKVVVQMEELQADLRLLKKSVRVTNSRGNQSDDITIDFGVRVQ